MQTDSQKLIHNIITTDFGCHRCNRNNECPVFLQQTTTHGEPRKNLPCLAYTYLHVANLILNKLASMPWNKATHIIVEHYNNSKK